MKYLNKTIWILSMVSLFTDVASEMLYPVMPIYLKSIGFSIVLIGILEGIAEATAGLSKGYFGKLSDARGKRLPFIRLGYGLSAISKPLMAFFIWPWWIFSARTLDRLGKGIRTSSRDAMLSDQATPETKGRVFGFHRGMDTLGAAIGPAIALVFLFYNPNEYRTLFYIAFFPGITAIALTFFIREKKKTTDTKKTVSFFSFLKYWKTSPKLYRQLVIGLLIFTLFNSSDVFLLLKLKESGLSDIWVIGAYIFYNLIYAIFSLPLGILADKIGLKKVFITGLLLFVIVYFGFAFNSNIYLFFALFFVYGIYSAASEGISKAWISNIASRNDTATAIGTYTAFQSICTMLASTLTGFVWYSYSAKTAFLSTAIITLIVVIYLIFIKTKPSDK